MQMIITILAYLFVLTSCGQTARSGLNGKSESDGEAERKGIYSVETYRYDSLTIPHFFEHLAKNHIADYIIKDDHAFIRLCSQNNLDAADSVNIQRFYVINILHDLFTSQSAYDCSRGEILNIPYMWHWVKPNPRHEIYFVRNKTLLKDTKPPNEFSKYNSFADVDRTPYLFLSDLVSPELKYYSPSCDTFSTFGWCSEREMAFVALVSLLGMESKVVAEGNHSWSELLVPMKLNGGGSQSFTVLVDNTFDEINWRIIDQKEILSWKSYFGNTQLSGWYNNKAKSASELNRIRHHVVSERSAQRIENKLVSYLNGKINSK
jgi:hypothetical protein